MYALDKRGQNSLAEILIAFVRRLTPGLLLRTVLAGVAFFCGLSAPTSGIAVSWDHSPSDITVNAGIPGYSADQRLSKGVFLVANARIRDPRFSQTVILIVEHDRSGALGLIVNRPTETSLSSILPEIEGLGDRQDTVRYGGPVSMHQIFILMRSSRAPAMAQHVFGNVYYSTSRKLLDEMLARGKDRGEFLLYAGYAGWAGGQIENELRRGDWSIVPADAAMIFDREPAQVWHELTNRAPALQVRRAGLPSAPEDSHGCPGPDRPGSPQASLPVPVRSLF